MRLFKRSGSRWQLPFASAAALLMAATSLTAVGLTAKPADAATNVMIWPTTGQVTSACGERWGRAHNGIDIGVNNQNVAASYSGTAYVKWDANGYGNYIEVVHPNGYKTLYAHLSKVHVSNGSSVTKGQLIATSGNTGSSTGPHLHFELRLNGVAQCSLNAARVGSTIRLGDPMPVDVNLAPASAPVRVANVSPAGQMFIKEGQWGTWSPHTGANQARSTAISPDGQLFANSATDGVLYIKQGLWGAWQGHTGPNDSKATALGPNGMVANVNGCGALWIKTGLWAQWSRHTDCNQSKAVAISPDGQTIASVSPAGQLFVKQGLWGAWQSHTAPNDSIATAVGPNNMIANVNGCGALWIKQGIWGTWNKHTDCNQSKAVSISKDGQFIASVSPAGQLFMKQGLWGGWVAHTDVNQSSAVAVQS